MYPKDWVEYGNKPTNKSQSHLIFKQGQTVKNKTNEYGSLNQRVSFNNLTIYKTKVRKTSMDKYIEMLDKSMNSLNLKLVQHKNSFSKQSTNYYIHYKTIRPVKNTKREIIPMNLTNHFIKHGEFIYKISFMFKVEKEKEYLDDAAYILNSFKFIDGTSLK